MKRTLNIGIGKRSFVMDEDAYQRLNGYLGAFRKELGGAYGSDEVMDDLEMRIADIFADRLAGTGNVVDIRLVNEVISQLGMPNGPYRGYDGASDGGDGEEGRWEYRMDKPRRRLYRNPDDKILFGVCGGLGAYLDIDSAIIRLLMVILLFLGSAGFWIYLVLLIIAPVARTPVQKCEMMGIAPTAENLNRFRNNKNNDHGCE